MKMRMAFLACEFGALLLTATITVFAEEDAADGEVRDEGDDTIREEAIKGEGEASMDVSTTILFTTPYANKELVAGQLVKFLVGFANRGEKDFVVLLFDLKGDEFSFRYPMDYSYHIQNFTAAKYDQLVQPKQEATFDYAFVPSEQYIGRPLGLVVNLHYVDQDDNFYTSAVFNETVQIVEDESSFSTETGFLYVVFAAIAIVLLFIAQHYLSKFTRKQHAPSLPPTYETGTGKNSEVDFEWIPRSSLEFEKKSPKMGSPRNRKAN